MTTDHQIYVGRLGRDVPLWVPAGGTWADDQSMRVSGTLGQHPDATLEESRVLREQLLGLLDRRDEPVVPVEVPSAPELNGYYEIADGGVETDGASFGTGAFDYDLVLRRARASVVEAHLLHVLRAGSAVSAGNADPLVGVPGSATVYRRGTISLGSLAARSCEHPAGSGTAGSVLVHTWADTDDQANAAWQVAPADFYEGAAKINRFLTGSPGQTRAILGRQVPGGLDPNTGWTLGNGLVAVVPSEALGGTAGTITVLSWAGTGYESETEVSLSISPNGSTFFAISDFADLSITRNSPEVTTIRLRCNPRGTLDLTVRRGDRMVLGVWNGLYLGQRVGFSPGGTTDLTGATRATSNDADGNRGVLASALATPTGGVASTVGADSLLDFGFGHEIGGSGATGIETAQSLANQYAAHVGTRCRMVLA